MPFFGVEVGGCPKNSTHLAHLWTPCSRDLSWDNMRIFSRENTEQKMHWVQKIAIGLVLFYGQKPRVEKKSGKKDLLSRDDYSHTITVMRKALIKL